MASDAIHWLIKNNPHYSDIELNYNALNSLPENNVPSEILSIETDETTTDDNITPLPDFGHDGNTDSSSFLPVNNTHQQEIDFIRNNLSQGQINWPTLGNSPLNEYVTPYLATMAFPTLFPDVKKCYSERKG